MNNNKTMEGSSSKQLERERIRTGSEVALSIPVEMGTSPLPAEVVSAESAQCILPN